MYPKYFCYWKGERVEIIGDNTRCTYYTGDNFRLHVLTRNGMDCWAKPHDCEEIPRDGYACNGQTLSQFI